MRSTHDSISPTAFHTAYGRTFTDIPYSQEVFAALEGIIREQPARGASYESLNDYPHEFAPRLEARYKLINKVLLSTGITQVLELACGLGTRGLTLAEQGFAYVETDLPAILAQKKQVFSKISKKMPPSLHLEPADALSLQELTIASKHFDSKKEIAVVHEGLLRYLSFEEKKQVARNVHSLLQRFGGAWITPDITLKEGLATEDKHRFVAKTKKVTGVDITQNAFENVDEAKKFFEREGFSIRVHKIVSIAPELVSPTRLGISEKQTRGILTPWVVFEMRVK